MCRHTPGFVLTSPSAAELLETLRALHGDALAESLAWAVRDETEPGPAGVASRVPEAPRSPDPASPETYWARAEAMLKDVRGELGTLYGPLVAIVTLAQLHAREGERTARFVAPLWVIGALCGLSRDRTEEVLREKRALLARFCYHKAWATSYTPRGKKDAETGTRWGGTLFAVPLPDGPYTTGILGDEPVRGWRALFRAERYRDLSFDVHRRFTETGWKEKHAKARARHGASKNPGLPTGERLALLETLVADRFGRAAVNAAREREALTLTTTHEVLHVLKEGPQPGRDGVAQWARTVADGLGKVLGDPSRPKVWLAACWAAWRVSKAGLADGFSMLHEAAFETLVRRADMVPRRGASRGATFNWVLGSLGLRDLDRQARRLTTATA